MWPGGLPLLFTVTVWCTGEVVLMRETALSKGCLLPVRHCKYRTVIFMFLQRGAPPTVYWRPRLKAGLATPTACTVTALRVEVRFMALSISAVTGSTWRGKGGTARKG